METTIKIGRKEYTVQKGDYILWNGACYQFCAGDKRILKQEGFNSYTHLRVPASAIKSINLKALKYIRKGEYSYYFYN